MALKIRALTRSDIEQVRKIHERDYPDLEFPLSRPQLASAIIVDEDDSPVITVAVEGIAEALLVTDKSKSRIKIGKALVEAQRFAAFTCGRFNIQELHAFVSDNDDYVKHLIQHGFHKREETVLRMKL